MHLHSIEIIRLFSIEKKRARDPHLYPIACSMWKPFDGTLERYFAFSWFLRIISFPPPAFICPVEWHHHLQFTFIFDRGTSDVRIFRDILRLWIYRHFICLVETVRISPVWGNLNNLLGEVISLQVSYPFLKSAKLKWINCTCEIPLGTWLTFLLRFFQSVLIH